MPVPMPCPCHAMVMRHALAVSWHGMGGHARDPDCPWVSLCQPLRFPSMPSVAGAAARWHGGGGGAPGCAAQGGRGWERFGFPPPRRTCVALGRLLHADRRTGRSPCASPGPMCPHGFALLRAPCSAHSSSAPRRAAVAWRAAPAATTAAAPPAAAGTSAAASGPAAARAARLRAGVSSSYLRLAGMAAVHEPHDASMPCRARAHACNTAITSLPQAPTLARRRRAWRMGAGRRPWLARPVAPCPRRPAPVCPCPCLCPWPLGAWTAAALALMPAPTAVAAGAATAADGAAAAAVVHRPSSISSSRRRRSRPSSRRRCRPLSPWTEGVPLLFQSVSLLALLFCSLSRLCSLALPPPCGSAACCPAWQHACTAAGGTTPPAPSISSPLFPGSHTFTRIPVHAPLSALPVAPACPDSALLLLQQTNSRIQVQREL